MEIAPREKVCRVYHWLFYLTKCVHKDLIGYLQLFRIPEAINARAFKFDTNIVVSVTIDINSGFC